MERIVLNTGLEFTGYVLAEDTESGFTLLVELSDDIRQFRVFRQECLVERTSLGTGDPQIARDLLDEYIRLSKTGGMTVDELQTRRDDLLTLLKSKRFECEVQGDDIVFAGGAIMSPPYTSRSITCDNSAMLRGIHRVMDEIHELLGQMKCTQ